MKCKRKKRGNGKLDKYKARGAARGDQLRRLYKKLGITPPDGSVKLTQPKLMNKLFKEYPPRQQSRRHEVNHPYGPANTPYP